MDKMESIIKAKVDSPISKEEFKSWIKEAIEDEEFKSCVKEAIKEWLSDLTRGSNEFVGRWVIRGVFAMVIAAMTYLSLVARTWHWPWNTP